MLRNLFWSERSVGCSRVSCVLAGLSILLSITSEAGAADIHVGSGRALQTLKAAVAAAQPHDRIVLEAGVYLDDVATIDKPLTIEGGGRGAILRITKPIANRKGILVVNADLTVRKITFEGAHVTDEDGKNGAGIRHQAGRLIVDTCVFVNNQNGILANANPTASVTVRRSSFSDNGAGDGYTHGIYVNAVAYLSVSGSTFSGTKVGHNVKSRALKTTVMDTVLDDGISGSPSYAIDTPNGGEVVLRRIRVTQGQRTSNSSMIAFGAEGSLHENSSLTITGSIFTNSAQYSTGIYNFTDITATLSDNTFENLGVIAKGLVKMNSVPPPLLREGAVFSGVDPNARSYFRLHNTGAAGGAVAVRLYDGRDGRLLGTWRSPNIPPNAAPQFSIIELERALGLTDYPPTYSIEIEPYMTGTFQHALHRPGYGVISNLTTCSTGVARTGLQIGSVHTSNLTWDYPASILVQNQGATPAAARIGIYDARDGGKMGEVTTSELPVDADLLIPIAALETGAGVAPAWDMGHWVIKLENDFTGTLQQLIVNQGAGVLTDMSTVCEFGVKELERPAGLNIGAVYRTPYLDSVLRVHNADVVAATVRLSIYNASSGERVAMWESPPLAPNASRQFGIAGIMPAAEGARPALYRMAVESGFMGLVQHAVHHGANGTLSNLSTCDIGTTATPKYAAYVRSSVSGADDVALLVISNFGAAAAVAELDVFDSLDGRQLGRVSTAPIPPGANTALSVSDLETGTGLSANSGIAALNVRLAQEFEGMIRHLLISTRTGTVSDMTTACAVGPERR